MSILALHDRGGQPTFDEAEARAAGRALAGRYAAAQPFPYIMLDDFIDRGFLRNMAAAFPDTAGLRYFDRDQERFKTQVAPQDIKDVRLRGLLMELNSQAFLGFLETLTGISGLIPDPYFVGGGLHETRTGGHLSVHADFNIHPVMKVERRLNLLIYLNEDWPAGYGGDLELWDRDMKASVVKVAPLLGRAVIFNTDADNYHGHPEPLACPPDRARRSIATYYYTALETGLEPVPNRTTRFQTRPGSGDRPDRRVAFDHFVQDWVPPRLQRYARRLNPFR